MGAKKFLALLYIHRAAKNPLIEAISLLVPMAPSLLSVLLGVH